LLEHVDITTCPATAKCNITIHLWEGVVVKARVCQYWFQYWFKCQLFLMQVIEKMTP